MPPTTTGKHRVETINDDGKRVITIRPDDMGVVWVSRPEDKIYFEQKKGSSWAWIF